MIWDDDMRWWYEMMIRDDNMIWDDDMRWWYEMMMIWDDDMRWWYEIMIWYEMMIRDDNKQLACLPVSGMNVDSFAMCLLALSNSSLIATPALSSDCMLFIASLKISNQKKLWWAARSSWPRRLGCLRLRDGITRHNQYDIREVSWYVCLGALPWSRAALPCLHIWSQTLVFFMWRVLEHLDAGCMHEDRSRSVGRAEERGNQRGWWYGIMIRDDNTGWLVIHGSMEAFKRWRGL